MPVNYLSPLRYPGAKRKMAHHIKELMQNYGWLGGTFVEPCCGGSSVSLYLLDQKIVSSAILVDIDPWITSFWQMLFFHTEQLIEDINNIDVTVETWERLRRTPPLTIRQEALYCFFFNRTCYSGILHGGIIGGKTQSSKYY
ncbi:DNA adenine methylase [Dictyobacter kobayashii]|uniref:DNA adenine methylase n=1 Tax=Dictyobacter kobayashii TaxID=2014872 RepID=UPI00353070BF